MRKAAFIALALVAALCLPGCTKGFDNTNKAEGTQIEPKRFVSDGPTCYVITDTETGVQYLFAKHFNGGGLAVLVDADGKPVTAKGGE